MRAKMEACPYDAAARALQCQSCCAASHGMPPCVAAWLASKAAYVELVEADRPANVLQLTPRLQPAA